MAYEIPLAAVRGSLDAAGTEFIRPEKSAPRHIAQERFLHFALPPVTAGSHEISITANLYAFGVVTLSLRIRASAPSLADFSRFHEPDLGSTSIHMLARKALDQVVTRISPHLEKGEITPEEPEAYTVFRFTPESLGLEDSESWLAAHRDEVAALLTAEPATGRLSKGEVEETVRLNYSYYRDDLVVIDWEGALVIERGTAADILRVIELANLQLVEYRHYDAVLDRVVTRAYDDLDAFYRRPLFLRGVGSLVRDLREIRINLSEVAEEIENSTKFFGDWHLARQYLGCATRFHLQEWKVAVAEKLKTVDELYNLVTGESGNRKMLILETIIVVLFIVDLVVLAMVAK